MQDDFLRVMDLLQVLKGASSDADTQVTAVITDGAGEILHAASNHHTHGVEPTDATTTRPEKYDWIEHAERNAIFEAASEGTSLKHTRMYIEGFPCVECARAIVMSGVAELWHGSTEGFDPVKYKFDKAREILESGNVFLKDWTEIMENVYKEPEEK